MWDTKAKMDFGKELDAAQAEAKAWKTLWSAGQGVATIKDDLPVGELISRMRSEFISALEEQQKTLQFWS
ncbi:MAG: nitronate monooxygenase [Granulosicoccus sp.]|jgi:nitronate monooxygenase